MSTKRLPLKVLRAAQRLASPWANGAGRTAEIMRSPEGESWDWRVSIATIEDSSEFSRFAGRDRLLMPLSGPLMLDVDGTRRIVDRHDVIGFSGEEPARALDVERPSSNLNVIVSRAWGFAELVCVRVEGESRLRAHTGAFLVVALDDGIATDAGELRAHDAVQLSPDEVLAVTGPAAVAVVTISRRPVPDAHGQREV